MKKKTRRFRFSLKTILIALTVTCVILAWYKYRVDRQKETVRQIYACGGSVVYDFGAVDPTNMTPRSSPWPDFLIKLLGVDAFHSPVTVRQYDASKRYSGISPTGKDFSPELIERITKLPRVSAIQLYGGEDIDQWLAILGEMKQLGHLMIDNGRYVTDDGIAHLSELDNLAGLIVWRCQCTDRSLEIVSNLPEMIDLRLPYCDFSDEGVAHLAKLEKLRYLDISQTTFPVTVGQKKVNIRRTEDDSKFITDKSVDTFEKIKSLTQLRIRHTGITTERQTQFSKDRPGCKVDHSYAFRREEAGIDLDRLKLKQKKGARKSERL